jgi:hypothetical protein
MTANENTTADACEIACLLPSEQQTERLAELMSGLLAHVNNVTELANGYAFAFKDNAQTREEIDAFIAFEQQCCEFMTYTVTENSAGQVVLELTGPEGTKEFLAKWIGDAGLPSKKGSNADTMKRAGALGATAAVFAAVCCATPALAAIMAALGIANATGTVAAAIDLTTPLLLAGSVGLFVVGRRRQSRAAKIDKNTEHCGC